MTKYTKNRMNQEAGSSEYIKLNVQAQGILEPVHFRIKMCTEMVKLKRSCAERYGMPITSLRFIHCGRRIGDNDTPSSMNMENEDVIEVYQEQTGGSQ